MAAPISNAADIPLSANTGTLPNMTDVLYDWMQPMVFSTLVKTIVNFQVVETSTNINFDGVWQPFTPEQLKIKPEGERSWSWFMLHSTPNLKLATDDVVTYQGVQYRVMARNDYVSYGYLEYHLILDFTGSGP